MVALATVNPRARHPITHYIMSWQDGEVPSAADIERAVDIFAAQLGIVGCQMLYGLHVDTENLHLHICLNRVHPETERPIRINAGYDIEACHQAIARIEAEQGWAPEVHSRYIARGANVYRTGFENDAPEITQKARDGERRTGHASVQQQVHHALTQVLAHASTWAELHAGLARFGIAYIKKGNGAVCVLDAVEVKASAALRKASIKALEKRFGPFEEWEADEIDDEIMPIRWPEPARHCTIKGGAGGALGLPVDGFECRIFEDAAYYSRRLGGAIEFIDRGSEIEVAAFRDEAAVLAALRLAAEKWPGDPLVIEGEPDFRRLVVRLAAREGLTLADPELQQQVEAQRQVQARAADIAEARKYELAHVDQAMRHLGTERFEILQPATDRRPALNPSALVAMSPDAAGFTLGDMSHLAEAEAQGIDMAKLLLVPLNADALYLAIDHPADIKPSVGDQPITFRLAHRGQAARQLGVAILKPNDTNDALIPGLVADHFKARADRISVSRHLPGALSLAALEQGGALYPDAGAAISACSALSELLQAQRQARADTAALLDGIGLPSRQLLREIPEPPAAEAVPSPEIIVAARLLRANMDAQPGAERRVHPSRIDADLALQLRVIGYPREKVTAVIAAEFAAAGRDDAWISPDLYADRIADSAFGPSAAERHARAAVHKSHWIQITKNADPATPDRSEAASTVRRDFLEARSNPLIPALVEILTKGKLGSPKASKSVEPAAAALSPLPPRNGLDELLSVMGISRDQPPPEHGPGKAIARDVQSESTKTDKLVPTEPGHPVAKQPDLNLEQGHAQTQPEEPSGGKPATESREVETPSEQVEAPSETASDRSQPESPFLRLLAKARSGPTAGRRDADAGNMVTTAGLEIRAPADNAPAAEGRTAFIEDMDPPHGEGVHVSVATSAPPTDLADAGATIIPAHGDRSLKPSPTPVSSRTNNVSVPETSRPLNNTVRAPSPLPVVSEGVDRLLSTDSMVTGGSPGTPSEPDETMQASSARAEHDPRAEVPSTPRMPDLPILTKSAATNLSAAKEVDQGHAREGEGKAGEVEISTPRVQSQALPPLAAPSPPTGATPPITTAPRKDVPPPGPVSTDPSAHERPQQVEGPSTAAQLGPSIESQPQQVSNPKPPFSQAGEDAPLAREDQGRRIEAASGTGAMARPAQRDGQRWPPPSEAAPSPATMTSLEPPASSKTVSQPIVGPAPDRSDAVNAHMGGSSPASMKQVKVQSTPINQDQTAKPPLNPMKPEPSARSTEAGNRGALAGEATIEDIPIAAKMAANRAIRAERSQQPAPRPPQKQSTPGNVQSSETPALSVRHKQPGSDQTMPTAADTPSPSEPLTHSTSPGVSPRGAASSTRGPTAQHVPTSHANPPEPPFQDGERPAVKHSSAHRSKSVRPSPPVLILETIDHEGSPFIVGPAMRGLANRFPEAVRRADITVQGGRGFIDRTFDPGLISQQAKWTTADTQKLDEAWNDVSQWIEGSIQKLEPKVRGWILRAEDEPAHRVVLRLLRAQVKIEDEECPADEKHSNAWLLARSLPAIAHSLPDFVQTWFDQGRKKLIPEELGALALLAIAKPPATDEEVSTFIAGTPQEICTEPERRLLDLAPEPPPPLTHERAIKLMIHGKLIGAGQRQIAEQLRHHEPSIGQYALVLRSLSALRSDRPIATQVLACLRPPSVKLDRPAIADVLHSLGIPQQKQNQLITFIQGPSAPARTTPSM
ncbi:MAG: relaxase/mobilization nuclease domain-containing protein [Burkholderiales bacterium]|nr:relaxase/mobilization nuclease domain-containing protein [Burkholderiales bacterium]